MKYLFRHKVKSLLVILGFTAAYFASTVLATLAMTLSLDSYTEIAKYSLLICGISNIVAIIVLRLHTSYFHQASFRELFKTGIICTVTLVINIILSLFNDSISLGWCIVCYLIFLVGSSVMVCALRIRELSIAYIRRLTDHTGCRVLIVGAGEAGRTVLKELKITNKIHYTTVGFIDDNPHLHGTNVCGVPVLGATEEIKSIAEDTKVELIIVAIPSASPQDIKRITEHALHTGCEIKVLPGLYQLINGKVSVSQLRSVAIEDLLGRDPISVNLDEVMGYIEGRTVLVTGGGGSIGSELCRQIAGKNPKRLIILDIYENNAYDIEQELIRKYPDLDILALIASVRDLRKMDSVFAEHKPEIVFHAAAHKHVPLMETSPNEAVKNNVIGTYNVVRCADKHGALRFVQISTDKAVNPTNIMGATKRVCEMIIQAYAKRSSTSFVAVRFGNVLGSNGSVIPLFKKQIAEGGPVTVTHKDIIRYFMTIPEAVSLVLQAGAYAKGGEIFVLDMGEQVRIYDLAERLIRLMGFEPHTEIEIKITGLRPGEKLYEERLMAEEGLKKTDNGLISIARPIPMDEDALWDKLKTLETAAYSETSEMKSIMAELVPTYSPDGGNKQTNATAKA